MRRQNEPRSLAYTAIACGMIAGACLLACLAGCTVTTTTTVAYDNAGNVVSRTGHDQKCIATFCGDNPNVQMRDGSGLNLKVGLPVGAGQPLPVISLQAGGFTELSSPPGADASSRAGVAVDTEGNVVSVNREVSVGQLD